MKIKGIFTIIFILLCLIITVGCGGSGDEESIVISNVQRSTIQPVIEKYICGIDHAKDLFLETSSGNINLPASSVASDYDIKLSKINTSSIDNSSLAILKSNIGIDSNAQFISPIIGIDINYANNLYRGSVNLQSNGFPLLTVASITINLDNYDFDWNNWYYYIAFKSSSENGWSFTPLKRENFQGKLNQLTANIVNISKYYTILRMPMMLSSGVVGEATSTQTYSETQTQTQTQTEANPETVTTNPETDKDTQTKNSCLIKELTIKVTPENISPSDINQEFEENLNISVCLIISDQ